LALTGLAIVVVVALFGVPGVLIEMSVLVLGLIVFGSAVASWDGGRFKAGVLTFLLAVVLVTGTMKMIWLVDNLPSANAKYPGLPYVFVAAVCPLAVAVTALVVRRSPTPLASKIIRVTSVGLLVGFVPWFILMITGIAD
jgi:hypothetical protein